jgi:limonene-1,2-epoxide hydrolase
MTPAALVCGSCGTGLPPNAKFCNEMVLSTTADVKNLVASGGLVMVERVDIFEMAGKTFDVEITGVFEVSDDGRITRWRDYYDMRSLEERVAAALAAEG